MELQIVYLANTNYQEPQCTDDRLSERIRKEKRH